MRRFGSGFSGCDWDGSRLKGGPQIIPPVDGKLFKTSLKKPRAKRQEYYAVFAKSFKERIKEKGVMLFDLKELKRIRGYNF